MRAWPIILARTRIVALLSPRVFLCPRHNPLICPATPVDLLAPYVYQWRRKEIPKFLQNRVYDRKKSGIRRV